MITTSAVAQRHTTAIVLTIALSLGVHCAAAASDITAREVTVALFNATSGARPDLSKKDMSNLDLSHLDFKRADLTGSNLFGADLSYANLNAAHLSDARLDRSTIMGTDFSGADLSRASILRPNVFSTIEGVTVDGVLEVRPKFARAKMIEANISGHLARISFKGADLTRAVFGSKTPKNEELISPRLRMYGCNFTDANLHDAILRQNDLRYAKFVNANLTGVSFVRSNLASADFRGADLTGADFTDADITDANFDGAKGIERAKGLDLTMSAENN